MGILLLPLLLIAALFSASKVRAGVPYDICAACTYPTIQAAVNDDATVGTTLTIAPETFPENVEITRSITLIGAGPSLTIVDGQMTDTVFLISDGATVSISDLTIQNGDNSSEGAGGLTNESSTVTLTNLIIENNKALDGAGIFNDGTMVISQTTVRFNAADEIVAGISICDDCTGGGIYNMSVMTITDSFIYSNTAQFGGGIANNAASSFSATNIEVYENEVVTKPSDPSPASGGGIENSGIMTLTSSIVRNNVAFIGGGIANGGTLTMMNSDAHDNMGSQQGGGLYNSFNATIQTSNFYNNNAGSDGGGGISSESGTVLVEQTAVYNNSATGSGGGILHNVTIGVNSFILRNSTVSGNSTSGAGGGFRNAGVATTALENVTVVNNTATVNGRSIDVIGGSLTIENSIFTNTTSPTCSGSIGSLGYNIANDGSCSLTGTADLPNTNPLLGSLQNNGGSTLTHALLAGSPAIDSGNNSSCPAVDQRGVARPFNTICDRGAYEFDQVTQSLYLPVIIR
jgi:hypothetical protein